MTLFLDIDPRNGSPQEIALIRNDGRVSCMVSPDGPITHREQRAMPESEGAGPRPSGLDAGGDLGWRCASSRSSR